MYSEPDPFTDLSKVSGPQFHEAETSTSKAIYLFKSSSIPSSLNPFITF